MKLLIIILASITFATSQDSNLCPGAEVINPCTCIIGSDSKSWITCKEIKSVEELTKSVTAMKGSSVSNFRLKNSNIGVLPADIFNGMDIQSLSIVKTNLTKLSENRNRPALLGLENSLETLEIVDAFLDTNSPLSLLSLSHLKKLSALHLDSNIIPTIGNNWFESGPYGLKTLTLYNTSITTIGSHAFEALENLRAFALNGGYFPEITREMLPLPAVYLEIIDLSKNKLKALPDNIFAKMPSLEELHLENNELTTINEVVFAPVWSQLVNVYFGGNPIICGSDMKWIYKYRTPENLRGRCAGPPKFLNKEFANLTLSDFE